MKKVNQTTFGKSNGNCHQACLASIFEKELEEIPNFMSYSDDEWFEKYTNFMLETFNLYPICLDISGSADIPVHGYHLIIGKSPQGEMNHSIVGYNKKPVHDPLPGGNCELKSIDYYEIFAKALE